MKEDCTTCQHNYTRDCCPADVAACFKNGRYTKWKMLSNPEFCPYCGEETSVGRTNKDSKDMAYGIPRTRVCKNPECPYLKDHGKKSSIKTIEIYADQLVLNLSA